HVGQQRPRLLLRGVAVARLPHDRDVRLGLEDQAETGAQQRLVVHQQHPDRHDPSFNGNLARTSKPPPDFGPTLRIPPQSATRSLTPTTPGPASSGSAAPPRPSSTTRTSSSHHRCRTVTTALAPGPACRKLLVSASWTMR